MKLLFVCDDYYPEPNASSFLASNIIRFFKTNNIYCDILNVSSVLGLPKIVVCNESKIFNETNKYRISINQTKGLRKMGALLYRCLDRINRFRIKKGISKQIEKRLTNIFRENEYDFIIPVVSDFNNGNGVMNYCLKSKKKYILYQTDPIGSNFTQIKYQKRLKAFENLLYKNSFFVVTTPIIAKEKSNDDNYNSSRIVPLEFPNVVVKESHKLNSDTIFFTFCGHLISGVRDCSYGLTILSQLDLFNFSVTMIGSGQEDLLKDYSSNILKNKMIVLGPQPKRISDKYIIKSHFLLNFDNSMSNQVPSKIFDYISTGRPIINFCKNVNSPTLKYLEKYGLFLNVIESNDVDVRRKQIKAIESFVLQNINKQKDPSDIENSFAENTPEYVGQRIIDSINSIVR